MGLTEEANIAADVARARAVPGPKSRPCTRARTHCGPTAKETKEYYHYLVHETGDRKRPRTLSPSAPLANSQSLSPELTRKMKERVISGGVTFPVIGRYHEVAEKFLRLVERGRERIDGIALILVNYVNETPALQNEVLPRLEWPKVREGRL